MAHKHIYYSKYFAKHCLPRELSNQVPKTHLMSQKDWRRLGGQQSLGWVYYMLHEPEPHILLFRQPHPKEQQKQSLVQMDICSNGYVCIRVVVFSEYLKKECTVHQYLCMNYILHGNRAQLNPTARRLL
ncbi:LOW QUALITY PROTEIN: cyclin-dependent kinases regulatory subunit 2-like [Thomomys bottae]